MHYHNYNQAISLVATSTLMDSFPCCCWGMSPFCKGLKKQVNEKCASSICLFKKRLTHFVNFFIIHNVYLLKIRGNWFCLVFSLNLFFFFWAGYVEYIPGLLFLFLNFFLAIVFDTCVQLLKFQVTLSVHTISDAP
jgi:hypothetical protein